jgi:hypothetical protein
MGMAGWRLAHVKRNSGGRAATALDEDWQMFCSAMVAAAAGSIIMLGIIFYNDLQ